MNEPARELCAHLSSLPGVPLPPGVHDVLRRRELRVIESDGPPIEAIAAGAFPLIWVDQQWAAGLRTLEAVESLELRARCVLMGREPPADLGPRLRALGALTYVREDFPGWLVRPIRQALDRLITLPSSRSYALLHAMRGPKLEQEAAILEAIVRLGSDLFQADRVCLLVRRDDASPLCVLSARDGAVHLVPWQEVDDRDPTPLFDAVARFGDQLALPSLQHAPTLDRSTPMAEAYGGAAAQAFHVGPQLRAALLLLWRERFLLNPVEVVGLHALAQLAGAAWTHLTTSLAAKPASNRPSVPFASPMCRDDSRRQLLQTVAELAGVQAALLVLADAEEAPARLHFACDWFADDYAGDLTHRDLHCARPAGTTASEWRARVGDELERLGSDLQVLELLFLPRESSEQPQPPGIVLLVGRVGDPARLSSLRFLLSVSAANERLRSDWLLLGAHGRVLAEAAFDRFNAEAASRRPWDTHALLARGAMLVAEVVPSDQVIIQYGRERVCYPELPETEQISGSEASLTRFAKRANVMVRVLDAHDAERQSHQRVDHVGLGQLAAVKGWKRVRSLIICPFGDGVGMLHVATSERGAFLTGSDARRVSFLANKLGRLAVPTLRSEVLKALNELASRVAGLSGQQLATNLVTELEAWSARFIRGNCQILLRARDARGSIVLEGASPTMPAPLRLQLEAASPPTRIDHGHLVKSQLSLAHAGMTGELYLVHRQPLPGSTGDYLSDAARELSLVLNAEYVRHELRKQIGIFRHELVGPIQGLASNAKWLLRELQQADRRAPELEACMRAILEETRHVSQWRERHRLFASYQEHRRLDVRLFSGELRPLLTACVKRFESAMADRNLTLRWDLPRGGVQAHFDAYALDIALSNLLDNAIKYAFYNREIVVGLRMLRGPVQIWVEDVGHGIPADRSEQIYLPGGRAGQHDPLRVIHGEGLGLFIAREIARAHDGDLTHTVRREGHEGSDKTPYRVRFTLTLDGG